MTTRTAHIHSFTVVLAMSVLVSHAFAQSIRDENSHSTRIGIAAGLGVNYHTAKDLVDRINGSGVVSQRVADFKSGVEFFGAVTVPVSSNWVLKGEYSYLLASYSQATSFGNSDFTYIIHMPTLIGQYILGEESTYNFKAGVGVGYHFGVYEESILNDRFTGSGIGTLVELEANTALGEALYAYLGVQMRWDFIGNLKNERGVSPLGNTAATTLHFFGVGARLGITHYF